MVKNKKPINAKKLLEVLYAPEGGGTKPEKNIQRSGELRPGKPVTLETAQNLAKAERRFREVQGDLWDLNRQEKLLYNHQEKELEVQIKAIQEELKKLALSTQNLAKEVEIAAVQAPVEPGVYHVNFFEKIRQAIVFLKKRVDESTTWLAEFNKRSKKRNYFWSQVRKSGTKFMLSPELSMTRHFG